MAIKKIEIRPKGDGTYPDVLYPKTSSDMVEGLPTEISNAVNAHASDAVKHITSNERNYWNEKRDYRTSGATTVDPNTELRASFATTHANVQNKNESGVMWFVNQTYYGSGNDRTQWASTQTGDKSDFKVRHLVGSTWSEWSPNLQSLLGGGGNVEYGYATFFGATSKVGKSYSFTVPDGVKKVYVSGIGSGGGGSSAGAGGSTGTIAYRIPINVSPNDILTIIIGSSGSANSNGSISTISTPLITNVIGLYGGKGATSSYDAYGQTLAIRDNKILSAREPVFYAEVYKPQHSIVNGSFYQGISGANKGYGGDFSIYNNSTLSFNSNMAIANFLSSFPFPDFFFTANSVGAGGYSNSGGSTGMFVLEWGL